MTTSKRSRSTSRLTAALAAAMLAAGGLAACGGDDDSSTNAAPTSAETTTQDTTTTATSTGTTESETETETETQGTTEQAAAAGKEVFTQNCGSCHTLSDAGASGQVGPNLDDLKPNKSTVAAQVHSGGGAMPSFKGTLSEAQINAVASYVADVAGK